MRNFRLGAVPNNFSSADGIVCRTPNYHELQSLTSIRTYLCCLASMTSPRGNSKYELSRAGPAVTMCPVVGSVAFQATLIGNRVVDLPLFSREPAFICHSNYSSMFQTGFG